MQLTANPLKMASAILFYSGQQNKQTKNVRENSFRMMQDWEAGLRPCSVIHRWFYGQSEEIIPADEITALLSGLELLCQFTQDDSQEDL